MKEYMKLSYFLKIIYFKECSMKKSVHFIYDFLEIGLLHILV